MYTERKSIHIYQQNFTWQIHFSHIVLLIKANLWWGVLQVE